MIIVKWKNLVNNRQGSPKFANLQEANEWIDSQKAKASAFGKGPQTIGKGQHPKEDILKLSEFSITDEDGKVIELVSLKAEYEIEIKEINENDVDDPDSISLRIQKALNKAKLYKKYKDAGEMIELFFTALINERQFDSNKKNQLQSNQKVAEILTELRFGRIGQAKSKIDAIQADNQIFFQDDLNAVSRFCADILASEV